LAEKLLNKMHLFLLFVIINGQTTYQPSNSPTASKGEPDCPCLDLEDLPEASLGGRYALEQLWNATGYRTDENCVYIPTHRIDSMISEENSREVCYPINYGFGECREWDLNMDPYCNINGELFCEQSWCYVNDNECGVAHEKSVYINTATTDIYYSYATCGSTDYFHSGTRIKNTLKGRTLKVAYLKNTGGWKGTYWDEERNIWTGPTTILIRDISNEAEFKMEETPISSYAMTAQPRSNFSACVQDISYGRLDFCVAMFSETPSRISMAPITPQIAPNLVYLYVSENKANASISVWKPFSNELWISAALAICAVAFLMQSYETRLPANKTKAVRKHTREFGDNLYSSFQSVFGASVTWEPPRTIEARVLAFGFGFFILVLVNLYAAELTANLIVTAEATDLNIYDFEANSDLKLCTIRIWKNLILSQTDLVEDQIVESLGRDETGENYDNGLCDGVAIDYETYQNWQARGKHCDFIQSGNEPILTLSWAMYATNEVHRVLSYYLTNYKVDGRWREITTSYFKPPICGETSDDGEEELILQVKLRDSLQVFTIVLVFAVISLIIHGYKKCCPNQSHAMFTEKERGEKARRNSLLQEMGSKKDNPEDIYTLQNEEIFKLKKMLLEKEIKESMEGEGIEGGDSFEDVFKRKPDSGFEEALKMIMNQEIQRRVEKRKAKMRQKSSKGGAVELYKVAG